MNKVINLAQHFQEKYGQPDTTKLKDSVIRIFNSVNDSIAKLLTTTKDSDAIKLLTFIKIKLTNYLNQNQLNLPEYYNFIKNLISEPGWAKIDKSYKVTYITKPLEMAYTWMNKI